MTKRRPLIAGNWKMHLDVASAAALAREVANKVSRARHCDIAVMPPHPLIPAVARVLDGSPIGYGAQDISAEEEGAFTGEVSARMLLSLGCTYAIVGHSERREYHLESDVLVHAKTVMALKAGLIPVVCVGEKLAERKAEKTLHRIRTQVETALKGLDDSVGRVVLAYEPIWAIGTGLTATPAQAEEVHEFIRGVVDSMYGAQVAEKIRILYGGSVKPDNASALMSEKDVDGALVGGASLTAESFAGIVNYGD
ncbi:MAG: triose-phosphate isomerase [Deltaproteobacteria bacterium]|nr:triose-phosphate isomerase [Deltaproteobacteria bacterium]